MPRRREILKQNILVIDRNVFKGHLRDNWVLPAAHFELAANLWMERPSYVPTPCFAVGPEPAEKEASKDELVSIEKKQVQECDEHLEKAAKWESYDLDTRIGLR